MNEQKPQTKQACRCSLFQGRLSTTAHATQTDTQVLQNSFLNQLRTCAVGILAEIKAPIN